MDNNEEKRGEVAFTEDECPKSGYWQSVTSDQKKFYIKKREKMPRFNDKTCSWVFLYSKEPKLGFVV